MAKERVCKSCKSIYDGDICPNCSSKDFTESFKGKIEIVNPENSLLAQKLKVSKKGLYAIRL